jgi:hypothetical protein
MEKESAWKKYKKNLGDTRPWHLVNLKDYVSEEISNNRYSICMECPELIKLTKQCKKCGCFMAAKTKLEKAACPIGNW